MAWLEGVRVVERDERLDARLTLVEQALRAQPPAEVAAVRTMYKRIGLDPTKTRPSSEALLRRVRKGDPLPRINSLVDVCNWCSVEFQLPYGLYDAAHVEGDITLRLGARGRIVSGDPQGRRARGRAHDAGRRARPVRQPDVGFGPHDGHDRDRAGDRGGVRPGDTAPQRLRTVLDETVARMADFTGCRESQRWPPICD